jgi:hypothetical protein
VENVKNQFYCDYVVSSLDGRQGNEENVPFENKAYPRMLFSFPHFFGARMSTQCTFWIPSLNINVEENGCFNIDRFFWIEMMVDFWSFSIEGN